MRKPAFRYTGSSRRFSLRIRRCFGKARRGSAALETVAVERDQRVFHPSRWKVVGDNLLEALEHLEMMAGVGLRPKHDHRLQRRTAGEAAGDFADQNRRVFGKLEARAGPRLHAVERLQVFRTLLERAQHLNPSTAPASGADGLALPAITSTCRLVCPSPREAARENHLDRSRSGPRLPATSIIGGDAVAESVLAAVRVGPSKTEIREYPMPDIPADAALMKMEVAGIC